MPGVTENLEASEQTIISNALAKQSITSSKVGTISLISPATARDTGISGDKVVVDALPYIDSEYDEPGMREMVMALIEDEKKRYRPTKNYLEHMPPLQLHQFETEVMKKELERMNQRLPMETLSMKRYELPPPPTGKLTDLQAWSECVDNSYAQLEHQATRICNLETMVDYGCESWKIYLELLVRMVRVAQKQVKDIRKEIQDINWNRKTSQTSAGEQLKQLEASWVGLVSKNYEIEHACARLEQEIYEKKAALAQKQYMKETSSSEPEKMEAETSKALPEPVLAPAPESQQEPEPEPIQLAAPSTDEPP